IQPDLVITQHPRRNWERLQCSHPGHLGGGGATVRAVYPAAENRFAYPTLEHLPAFRIEKEGMMAATAASVNLRIDVSDYVEDKLGALHKHISQHPDPTAMDERVRSALAANHPDEGRGAEVFHQVSVNDLTTFAGF